jgi:hypothetical protein
MEGRNRKKRQRMAQQNQQPQRPATFAEQLRAEIGKRVSQEKQQSRNIEGSKVKVESPVGGSVFVARVGTPENRGWYITIKKPEGNSKDKKKDTAKVPPLSPLAMTALLRGIMNEMTQPELDFLIQTAFEFKKE